MFEQQRLTHCAQADFVLEETLKLFSVGESGVLEGEALSGSCSPNGKRRAHCGAGQERRGNSSHNSEKREVKVA